jgi:hypothetical protein
MSHSNSRSDIIDITCTIVRETEKAYNIDHGDKERVWVPKSLCVYDANDKTMAMPEWLAMEKGLI